MARTRPAIGNVDAPSLAVLPFKLLVNNDDEYLGGGLADALITRLSDIRIHDGSLPLL
ncbi:MAG TPA: hypothetical protein VJZ91_09445 [Blastocatellia bacterium]|nr:hypothetical protein [Blastocatellia bacterium]